MNADTGTLWQEFWRDIMPQTALARRFESCLRQIKTVAVCAVVFFSKHRLTGWFFLVSARDLPRRLVDPVCTWSRWSLPLWASMSHPLFSVDESYSHQSLSPEMNNARLASITRNIKCGIHERTLLPSYLTEPQMMMMSNTAKKKDNRTPRIICSSLVNRPSTRDIWTDHRLRKHKFCTQSLCLNKTQPAVLMCSEKSESVDWPLMFVPLNLNLVNNSQSNISMQMWYFLTCSCLHSHVYSVWLQRSVA